MQFTKAEEYGVFGVIYLAEKGGSSVIPLSEISEAQQIPEKFLAKIFQHLTKAGIVRSHRGVRGGFTLGREPSAITIKDVIESIQGPYHLMKCVNDMDYCERKESQDFCALKELVAMAERKLVAVFEGHTIADLVHWQASRAVNS